MKRIDQSDQLIESQRVRDWNPNIRQDGITKIIPCTELGDGGYSLWFAIYAGHDIIDKINGKYVVSVVYKRY
jgi:hypothetical protein